jgi:TRAP-type C4-dicarboxylate transport system permease small subunit
MLFSIFKKSVTKINNIAQNVCAALLFFMMVLGTADVIGRYFFNSPILGTLEVFEILLPALVLLGLGYTQENNAHVKVEIIHALVSEKTRAFLNIITCSCGFLISVIFMWRGFLISVSYYQMKRTIGTINVPLYLPQLLVPLGFVLLSFVFIIQTIEALSHYRKAKIKNNEG